MPSKGLAVVIAGLAVAVTALSHSHIRTHQSEDESYAFLPRPAVAKAVALGFDAVLADYYWLTAVQIIGAEASNPARHAVHLGRLVDVVTTLDPWVGHPYRFAAIWLTESEESVRTANRLLQRGIEHHPDDWRNYFYLGFNYFYYLQENRKAAEVLEKAIKLPGRPPYLPRLVARLRSEYADIDAAEVFLHQLVKDAPDEESRATYQGALDEIEVERKARYLDRARKAYRDLNGRDITRVSDLVSGSHPVIPQLPPPEPSALPPAMRGGYEWQIDLESDRIVSSFYGRRYELNVHPQDRVIRRQWSEQQRAKQREESQSDGG